MVLSKLGADGEAVGLNQSLTNLRVEEDGRRGRLLLAFGPDWDRLAWREEIEPGQVVQEGNYTR